MSTPKEMPVTEAIANPAATRSRLMRTYRPQVPEYHASAWRGPKIQSHQAAATVLGDGSDALDTHPAAVTTSQAIRIAAGSAIRRTRRQNEFRVASLFCPNCLAFDPTDASGTGSDDEVCVMPLQRRTNFWAGGGVPVSWACVLPVAEIRGPKSRTPLTLSETSAFMKPKRDPIFAAAVIASTSMASLKYKLRNDSCATAALIPANCIATFTNAASSCISRMLAT